MKSVKKCAVSKKISTALNAHDTKHLSSGDFQGRAVRSILLKALNDQFTILTNLRSLSGLAMSLPSFPTFFRFQFFLYAAGKNAVKLMHW